jgi:hypothetical protein
MGSGKAPKPTAEQKAMERLQREQLNKETASSERRLKSIAQKKIGKASLLGRPIEQAEGPQGRQITDGFQNVGGKIVSDRGAFGLLGRFVKAQDVNKAARNAAKGAVNKKSAGLTMLGKAVK